jgi:hypothetical protein
MGSITLRQLHKTNPEIDLLRLRSFDPDIYLVELVIANETWFVKDEQGRTLSFRSMLAAKKPFKGFKITRAEMLQESAYDEMVGHPIRDGNNTLQVTISLPDDDLS